MSKRAVILAGGMGRRLAPYTTVLPKPLMPLGDYPILEVIIRQLARQGFGHITLAVNHQAQILQAFFGDGSRWGLTIDYSLESVPLSTMGPLCLIADLPDNFLVMNGDVLTDLDMGAFLDQHAERGSLFTISAHARENLVDYGVLETDSAGQLSGFQEKPRVNFLVSMGIYALRRDVLRFIPCGERFGFDQLMHRLIAESQPVDVRPWPGYWLDIGRPDDYLRAIDEFAAMRSTLLPD